MIPIQQITKMKSQMTHLDKCKIPELKEIAKKYRIKVSGTKAVLLQRIREHMFRENSAISIQKLFRGYIVRYFYFFIINSNRSRSLCVNDSDSCTLEPLSEIESLRFFAIIDKNDFIYGFDIISLLMMCKKGNTYNPYNRDSMSRSCINEVKKIGRLLLILFSDIVDKSEIDVIDMTPPVIRNRTNRQLQNRLYTPNYTGVSDIRTRNLIFNTINIQPLPQNIDLLISMTQEDFTETEYSLLNKLVEIRKLPIEQRIRDLFIEIDLLGNYTQYHWFSTLDTHKYCNFFSQLYNLWNYRANLSPEIKQQICVLYDPFLNLRIPYQPFSNHLRVQEICTTVIENIVYGSPDPEYRKLGCMHVLTALTTVSREARHQLYWLYESL